MKEQEPDDDNDDDDVDPDVLYERDIISGNKKSRLAIEEIKDQ